MTHKTPYKLTPKVMVIALVMGVVKWMNTFPNKAGISRTMSPSTIIVGLLKPKMKFKRIIFESHVMFYAGTTSKMNARSVLAI